jgi:lipopolysaccharide export system protein LptA
MHVQGLMQTQVKQAAAHNTKSVTSQWILQARQEEGLQQHMSAEAQGNVHNSSGTTTLECERILYSKQPRSNEHAVYNEDGSSEWLQGSLQLHRGATEGLRVQLKERKVLHRMKRFPGEHSQLVRNPTSR